MKGNMNHSFASILLAANQTYLVDPATRE